MSRCDGRDRVGVHGLLSGDNVIVVPFAIEWKMGTSSNSTSESESLSCAVADIWMGCNGKDEM